MAVHKYLSQELKDREYNQSTINVVALRKKAENERMKEKKKNILIAAAAVSALAVSGFIVSL